jgi:hypothetical protein
MRTKHLTERLIKLRFKRGFKMIETNKNGTARAVPF